MKRLLRLLDLLSTSATTAPLGLSALTPHGTQRPQ
ncbi:hypothetical protein HNQ39_002656 [Armatimonas rosea]|uniref:Uncharacterized protein n=1 Tax=Armatimonas rosea TaxID=685828 RepID=A0A7W9W796_ARMRO|nr:hypothetical protein [Armatimonas rosea]